MFGTYSKYSISNFLAYFIASLSVLLFLFLAMDILTKIWDFDAGFGVLLKYSLYNVPSILEKMIPVATLFAGVLLFSNFSKTNELVAFYSIGKSAFNIILPIFFIVVFLSISLFYISDKIAPKYLYKSKALWNKKVLGKKAVNLYQTEKKWYKQKGFILGVDKVFPELKRLEGIKLYTTYNKKLTKIISAKFANVYKNKIILKQLSILNLKTAVQTNKEEEEFNIKLDDNIIDMEDVIYLSSFRIKQYATYLENLSLPAFKYWTEYYKRFSLAFSVLVMFFISISFSLNPNRRTASASKSISMGILIVFIYWLLFSTFLSLGIKGVLPSFFSAWIVNILFFSASIFLIYKKR